MSDKPEFTEVENVWTNITDADEAHRLLKKMAGESIEKDDKLAEVATEINRLQSVCHDQFTELTEKDKRIGELEPYVERLILRIEKLDPDPLAGFNARRVITRTKVMSEEHKKDDE